MINTFSRAILGACVILAAPASATTVTVGDIATLTKALTQLGSGDTIRLLPGNYGELKIKARKFGKAVTFVSADASRPARFDRISITDSTNVQLGNLEVATRVQGQFTASAIEVFRSRSIGFTGMNVHGVLDGDVTNDIHGLRISDSKKVTISKSSFHELRRGIVTTRTTGLAITDNAFTGIRVDGISNDAASSTTISRNRFSQFRPEGADHADAVQFFTNGTSMKNITVSDNLIIGNPAGQMQGIFMHGSPANRSLFDAVTVSDNILWATQWNGIAGFDAQRFIVTGNKLYSDVSLPIPKTWIRLENITLGKVANNYAGHYLYVDVDTLGQIGNIQSLRDDPAAAAVRLWDATHFASGLVKPFIPRSVEGRRAFGLGSETWELDAMSLNATLSAASAPEPAAWATMITGFGIVGLSTRRRRRQRFARA